MDNGTVPNSLFTEAYLTNQDRNIIITNYYLWSERLEILDMRQHFRAHSSMPPHTVSIPQEWNRPFTSEGWGERSCACAGPTTC
jgi:hypothetical protein